MLDFQNEIVHIISLSQEYPHCRVENAQKHDNCGTNWSYHILHNWDLIEHWNSLLNYNWDTSLKMTHCRSRVCPSGCIYWMVFKWCYAPIDKIHGSVNQRDGGNSSSSYLESQLISGAVSVFRHWNIRNCWSGKNASLMRHSIYSNTPSFLTAYLLFEVPHVRGTTITRMSYLIFYPQFDKYRLNAS